MITAVDEHRFRKVAKLVMPPAWRYLRALGIYSEDREDAMQVVLLRLALHWEEIDLDDRRRIIAFACGIARNVAFDMRRSRRARTWGMIIDGHAHVSVSEGEDEREVDEFLMGTDSRSPASRAESGEEIDVVDDILAHMSCEWREVFVLYEVEGLTAEEIAVMLGISRGAVVARLRLARAKFETLLRLRRSAETAMKGVFA